MTTGSFGIYHKNGRLRGSHVYLLLCRDHDGPMYLKIGMSLSPFERLGQLLTACPVPARKFATCAVPSRDVARLIERDLHKACARWRSHGEWVTLSARDKPEFYAAVDGVIDARQWPSWKLKWLQIDVQDWLQERDRRRKAAQAAFSRSSRARRDFIRASAGRP